MTTQEDIPSSATEITSGNQRSITFNTIYIPVSSYGTTNRNDALRVPVSISPYSSTPVYLDFYGVSYTNNERLRFGHGYGIINLGFKSNYNNYYYPTVPLERTSTNTAETVYFGLHPISTRDSSMMFSASDNIVFDINNIFYQKIYFSETMKINGTINQSVFEEYPPIYIDNE